jgi:hypothetical protein
MPCSRVVSASTCSSSGRGRLAVHEQELGAHQPDAGGTDLDRLLQLARQFEIDLQADLDAVAGDRRQLPNQAELPLSWARSSDASAASVSGDGLIVTVPALPLTMTKSPGLDAVQQPGQPSTAGMPSARAMIAVWLSMPPSIRGEAGDTRRVEQRRVGRRQLVGDQTVPSGRCRTPDTAIFASDCGSAGRRPRGYRRCPRRQIGVAHLGESLRRSPRSHALDRGLGIDRLPRRSAASTPRTSRDWPSI